MSRIIYCLFISLILFNFNLEATANLPKNVKEMRVMTVSEAEAKKLHDADLLEALNDYHASATFNQTTQEYISHPDTYVQHRIDTLERLITAAKLKHHALSDEIITSAEFKKAYLEALPKGLNPYAVKPEILAQRSRAVQLGGGFWFEFLDPLHRFDKAHFYINEWNFSDVPNYFIFLETMEYNPIANQLAEFDKYVKYYNDQERQDLKFVFKKGVVYYQGALAQDRLIFVAGLNGEFYGLNQKIFLIHHSSAFAGGTILGAGELFFKDGKILSISNGSGHYMPGRSTMLEVLQKLKRQVGNISGITLDIHDVIKDRYVIAKYDAQCFLDTKDNCIPTRIEGNVENWTPLHYLVWNSQYQLIPQVVKKNNLNAKTADGNTPLHFAVRRNNIQALKLLIRAGANRFEQNNEGLTPIDLSARSGNNVLFEVIIDGLSREALQNQEVLFLNSFAGNNLKIVQKLEKLRANSVTQDAQGNNLYHYAAEKGDVGLIQYIASKYLDLSVLSLNDKGESPLQVAVKNGNLVLIKYFISQGLDLRDVDSEGNTLLHTAAASGHNQVFQYLLEELPDVVLRTNNKGESLLHLSINRLPTNNLTKLIQLGLDVNALDNEGNTPLNYALQKNFYISAPNYLTLLENGASVLISNHHGKNLLTQMMLNDKHAQHSDWLGHLLLHTKENQQDVINAAYSIAVTQGLNHWRKILYPLVKR